MPVSVALASRKKSIEEILELGIGSIIHFDKPCDDPLELEVNGHAIAQGEAVKVGDKFGLRVQSVLLPNERFRPLKPSAKSGP
jgi:flagellar motor switch protein FliN